MGLGERWRRRRAPAPGSRGERKAERSEAQTHLREFAATRRGVEAYVEPATSVTPTTVVFIAADGEWTRRRVPGPPEAVALARDLAIPVYDVQLTGYPQRMRDFNERRRILEKRKLRADLEGSPDSGGTGAA